MRLFIRNIIVVSFVLYRGTSMAFLVVATSTHHKGEGRFSNQPKKPLPCFFAGWPVRILKSSQIEQREHKNHFFACQQQ
jgi:hypothetical protein